MLLYDPQTSGGLLLGLPKEKFSEFMAAAQEIGQPAWLVGDVIPGDQIQVVP
jgi:selenide, water dikinase